MPEDIVMDVNWSEEIFGFSALNFILWFSSHFIVIYKHRALNDIHN